MNDEKVYNIISMCNETKQEIGKEGLLVWVWVQFESVALN